MIEVSREGPGRKEREMREPYQRHYGAKYEALHTNPDGSRRYPKTSEIAAAIRGDIKAAVAKGELPKEATYSVRSRNFSGGCAIDVTVQDLPGAWVTQNDPEAVEFHGWLPEDQKVLSKQAAEVKDKVKEIWSAYNYDGSDVMTDYFDVNYYGSVDIEDPWHAQWRADEKARKAKAKKEQHA